ncbi:MAG: AMP-binding protein [Gracilibacteraceae bacterium]|nr:AMP-binding protein [Gracilibacteraceae bacterium]
MNIVQALPSSERIALIQGGLRLSYARLLDEARRFGGCLRRSGLDEGSHVLIFVPLSVDLYIALLGAWSIGAVPIFIDFSRGARFVADSVARLRPDAVVCDAVTGLWRHVYAQLRPILAVPVRGRGAAALPVSLGDAHPAILSFTSGSTGIPKIAARSHGFLMEQYRALSAHLDFDPSHVDLGTLPVFTLASLAAGLTTLLPRRRYRGGVDAARLARRMRREEVSRVICSPALFAALLNHGDLPSLRAVYLGGGPVYPSLLQAIRPDIDLRVVYGSTEAEPIAAIRWRDVSPEDKARIGAGAGLPVGAVVPGVSCRVGEDQEIQVSGATVLSGYLHGIGDAENKLREDGHVWHRTGDAGYFDDQGRLWLLGRVNQAVDRAGGKLYPFCAECVLDARFGIRGALAAYQGQCVVVVESGSVDESAALTALAALGVERVISVRKLPMDKRHGAKIDYPRLQKLLRSSYPGS